VAAPDRNALITAITVPVPGATTRVSLERYSRSANDLALINAALALQLDSTTIREPRLALGGVAATVVRVSEAEEALSGADAASGLDTVMDRFAAAIAAAIHPIDDTRGSAAYKTDIAVELCRRTLLACVAEDRI
jgi:CO/xanthine dehydrogenase FAD-binding subunit